MAKKNEIEESQQSREGKAIGSAGNQGGAITEGAKGPQANQEEKGELRIPNQERYSGGKNREQDNETGD
jgi:hypothetical protein